IVLSLLGIDFCFLICFSGYFSGLAVWGLTGPREVSRPLGESVSVRCQYHESYQRYKKYWCRGAVWRSCQIAVQTTGLEAEAKRDRVSIRDNHTLYTFTVTMENLSLEDAGIYWCGISKSGSDPGFPVNVTVLPGEWGRLNLLKMFQVSSVTFQNELTPAPVMLLICVLSMGIHTTEFFWESIFINQILH
uniref:Ig-like domain-containing protein n=1 Tax=Chelydra serpentina TaxID=8475 RepID=A0A8C3SWI0_CHESE